MFHCFVGDDIELRLLEKQNAGELFSVIERNRVHLRRWLPWVDRTRSADDIRNFLDHAVDAYNLGEEMHTGIWWAGRLVGSVGHHRIDTLNRNSSIGYWLDADVEGRGIMTRSCLAMLRHLFEERKLHRVEIRCATGNVRSCAIPARLGFTREGVSRGAEWVNDQFYDLVVWSMLEEEWRRSVANE
jgi:ribosomal-protein-serine acetyltransferase